MKEFFNEILGRLGSWASRKFLFMVAATCLVWFWGPILVERGILSGQLYSHALDMWWASLYAYLGFNLLQKSNWFNKGK